MYRVQIIETERDTSRLVVFVMAILTLFPVGEGLGVMPPIIL